MQLIIVLERTSVNPTTIRYVLRATVPVARQPYYADATKTSAYKDADPADVAALRAGEVLERVSEVAVGGLTVAQIKTALEAAQAEFQARVNEDALYNPYKWYGTSWNGTTWTTAGVN